MASLRALLNSVIDYAGLFPPAQLSLDQSIRNYARYRREAESWMLGRFVCPTGRLRELTPFCEDIFQDGQAFRISVLGHGGKDLLELADEFWRDWAAIVAFEHENGESVNVDAIELLLPALPETPTRVDASLLWSSPWLTVYCETAFDAKWRDTTRASIEYLTNNDIIKWWNISLTGLRLGYKLRCGGVIASSFPSPEQVAFTIVACRDAAIPLKFTAGLHHPIRQYDDGVQTKMHGFINVFAAGVLAHARRLNEEQVQAIIEDEDARNFVFSAEALRWKDWQATTSEVEAARRMVVSFGSCSFDEPRDDLRKLGWL